MPSKYASGLQGSRCGGAKLNETLVKRIRQANERKERIKRLLDERYSARALARKFSVSESAIEKVIAYSSWRHVL